MTDGEDHGTSRVRRRPTRRHRRNRLVRRIMVGLLVGLFAVGLSALALQYFTPSPAHSSGTNSGTSSGTSKDQEPVYDSLVLARESLRTNAGPARPVYPHSVVPGGVEDARELKWVAEHDPIVAEHYRGFDYDHARIVRLTLAQTAYVSYRIGNHVYWTRHRITLHKGEKLITDGRITVRARCGNRVEEVPQQLHESIVPAVAKFEVPVEPSQDSSTAIPPVEFESALLNRPVFGGPQPLAPLLSLYTPFPVGGVVPLSPPPLPSGVCSPGRKPGKGDGAGPDDANDKKKKKSGPCGANGVVPEPGTWLMLITGIVAMAWLARRKALAI